MKAFIQKSSSLEETKQFASTIGKKLRGGEVFELISDLGGGKTSFVSGLAAGFGSVDPVASPSFTLNYVYRCRDGMQLSHFDFYRLDDPGIVANELSEIIGEPDDMTPHSFSIPDIVTAVEWGDIVHNVLPNDRIRVSIATVGENARIISFKYSGAYDYLFENAMSFKEYRKK